MSKEKGYVYILTNPSFREDWVKIGKSARPVDVRSNELDNTAVPLPFEIYATLKTSKYNEVERKIHKEIDLLTDLRIRQNREFFNVKPQVALEILQGISEILDDAELEETFHNKTQNCSVIERTDNKIQYDKEKKTVNNVKIGEYVQYSIKNAYDQGLISKEEISNLQDKEYSKTVFNQRFEILRHKNQNIKDKAGRNRYYTKELFFGEYYLTSQWYDYHFSSFNEWLGKIKYNKE